MKFLTACTRCASTGTCHSTLHSPASEVWASTTKCASPTLPRSSHATADAGPAQRSFTRLGAPVAAGADNKQSTAHCKARRRGAHGNQLRHQSPPSAVGATPATQSEGGCQWVPRLRRKTKVDVAKCHACHAKWRWMSVSATPATQNEGGCRQVPRLPRKVKVDVSECHACHAKGR